jgi:hypothetical protein
MWTLRSSGAGRLRPGRWDGARARSPRVSTRGFLDHARYAPTKSPRRKPGDTGSNGDPACHACGRCAAVARGVCGMDGGRLRHGRWDGARARSPRVSTRGFLGHARYAPTKSPRREPGDTGLNGDPACHACGRCAAVARGVCGMDARRLRHGRWDGVRARSPRVSTRGFLDHARYAPTKSPRREPGDTGSNGDPACHACGRCAAVARGVCGMDGGMVFMPGVPGFPPGASWAAPDS